MNTLNINGQPLSANSIKTICNALTENIGRNWIENLGLAHCELNDECTGILGTYLNKTQVGNLEIGGNRMTYKGITKLLQDLLMSGESGRLKALDISDTI